MNERSHSAQVWHRMANYAIIKASFQSLLGLAVLATMYGRGALVLVFLLLMANVAYPWLMENAIRVGLWPPAILVGTVFMFFVITVIGESINRLKMWASRNQRWETGIE